MEIKDKIEFTDVSKIFIENLNKSVDHFQDNELIFVFINNGDKIK